MKSLKDFLWAYKKSVVIVIVFVVLILIFSFMIMPSSQKYVTELIENMIKQQTENVLKDYRTAIELQQLEIENLKKQKATYDKNINDIRKKIGVLENEITQNTIPTTDDEMRHRFIQLGYPPVN